MRYGVLRKQLDSQERELLHWAAEASRKRVRAFVLGMAVGFVLPAALWVATFHG